MPGLNVIRALTLLIASSLAYGIEETACTESVDKALNFLEQGMVSEARALFGRCPPSQNARTNLLLGAFLLDNPAYEVTEYEAYYLLKSARDSGASEADLMLGYIYDRTNRHPFHKQTFKSKLGAFKSYMAASEQGEPRAFWALSAAYFEGRIVDRDLNKVRVYAEKAARLGLPAAQYLTAILYSGVEDLGSDPALSEFWMCKAARSGFQDALSFTNSAELCVAPNSGVTAPSSTTVQVRSASSAGSSRNGSSASENFFGLFAGAFFQALGEAAAYKITGIDPPSSRGFSDQDLEEFRRIGRQEARRAVRHQERMRQIYRNIRSTSRIGY